MKKTAIGLVGVGAAGYVLPASALGRDGNMAPSDRIVVGSIGVGPQGTSVMRNFMAHNDCRVVAICDLKKPVRESIKSLVDDHYQDKGCATFEDFREILQRKDIDVVTVAPPDHWHVLVALAAARAGKDIYLEKPMGLSLAEDQALRTVCRQKGTVFQFGTQQRSDAQFRLACDLARNKRIGKLHTIYVWSTGSTAGGPMKPVPLPPDYIDYDFWLGPAPRVPYTEDRCENKWWWFISDYALGFIAGWGIHPMDIALWGGGDLLKGSVEVDGTGECPPATGVCDTALNWDVSYQFQGGVTIKFHGFPIPAEWKNRFPRAIDHGTAFVGTEGWIHVDRAGIDARPKSILDDLPGTGEIHLPVSRNHARNLLDCVRTRSRTVCPIEEAVLADIFCHIGDIAIRTRQKLLWDQDLERFKNNETANRSLTRAMRSPWSLRG
jgi:predicted dehydrogenase